MSRLTIEISDQQHQSIKAAAALNGQSIKEYALQRLFSHSTVQDEQQAWHELKAVISERIAQAERGEVSTKSFDQIVEEALRTTGAK